MNTDRINLSAKEFQKILGPLLLGSVFHFTNEGAWQEIKRCGYISTNKLKKYSFTSIHSQESLGHHLNAVCLFDLREKSIDIFANNLILFDFFSRRWGAGPVYLLVLKQRAHIDLETFKNVDEDLLKTKMYIPQIESWHIGDLPLDRIDKVYEINVSHQ